MSRILGILLLITVGINTGVAQTKHALIIAIGNYPQESGWRTISSSRDLNYIEAVLLQQGFNKQNIKQIVDSAAIYDSIAHALESFVEKVERNDVVWIHISAHGAQVEDDNGDEIDGLDESIASYGSIAPSHSKDFKNDQSDYFRDDQFGVYINQIRRKLGKFGDVVVFMDVCHSGSGTRGQAIVRGGEPPLISTNFNKEKYNEVDSKGVFREDDNKEHDLASYIVYSAARAEEVNAETKNEENSSIGSLTYAIYKVFSNLSKEVTYRSLFSKIQSVMNVKTPGQQPVMEGNGADRIIMGGQYVRQKPYFEIAKIKGKQLNIKGGKLSGLDSGARIKVCRAGTIDPEKTACLATGTIVQADLYTATVVLNTDLNIKQAVEGWVFITEPVYNLPRISVAFQTAGHGNGIEGFSDIVIRNVKDSLKDFELISFQGEPEILLLKGNRVDSIKIASNGHLFAIVQDVHSYTKEFKEVIHRYARYKFLQELEIKHPNTKVEIKLVPVIDGHADIVNIDSKIVNGTYEFHQGDTFCLLVKNNGRNSVYINVLDLQPDGIINPILPNRDKNIYPADLKIKRGATVLLPYKIHVEKPYGLEVFKIFVSRKEIDMEEITRTRGAGGKNGYTILEACVLESFQASYRSLPAENVKTDEDAFNILFRIKPKS